MDQQFHQQISKDIGRLEGKLDLYIPTQEKIMNKLIEIQDAQDKRLKALEEDSTFKKGKMIGISTVTSAIMMVIAYFIPK